MPSPQSVTVELAPHQQRVLEKLCRAKSASRQLSARCKIILLSVHGMRNQHQAEALGLDRLMIRRWRKRWAAQQARLDAAARAVDKDRQAVIVALPSDAPPKFTPEQVAALIALAANRPRTAACRSRTSPLPSWRGRRASVSSWRVFPLARSTVF